MRKIVSDIMDTVSFLQTSGHWPAFLCPEIMCRVPAANAVGDFSCAIAQALAPLVEKDAYNIGIEIKAQLRHRYEKIEVERDGVMSFVLPTADLLAALQQMRHAGERYGKINIGKQRRRSVHLLTKSIVLPLSLADGRALFINDVMARVYTFCGWRVTRRVVMRDDAVERALLGESVTRRYLQHLGMNVPYAEQLLPGAYIRDLAQRLELRDYKINTPKKMEWIRARVATFATRMMTEEIQKTIIRGMRIPVDEWQSWQAGAQSSPLQEVFVSSVMTLREGTRPVRSVKPNGDAITTPELLEAFGPTSVRLLFLLSPREKACDLDLSIADADAEHNVAKRIAQGAACMQHVQPPLSKQQHSVAILVPTERTLLRHLLHFPLVVEETLRNQDGSMLARYALELSHSIEELAATARKSAAAGHSAVGADLLTTAAHVFPTTCNLLGIKNDILSPSQK